MDVLFIHSEEDYYSRERPLVGNGRMQFGISYISAVLKQAGHNTGLVVPTPRTIHKVDEYVRNRNPGLICFTSVHAVFDFLYGVAGHIKKRHPEIFLLAGGTHVSLDPDECLKSAFDAVCIGEGEYPTLELIEQLESGKSPTGIPNLYIKHGSSVERNHPRPFIADLDSLPFPDREMWVPWYFNPLSTPSVLTGRGCPFQCTYCCNHALARLSEGGYVRVRSPENIVEEIRGIKEVVPGLVDINLEAETLGCNREWALELCSHLEKMNTEFEVPARFCSNLRVTPNIDYEELFSALERSNFFGVNIGLESGSERIRREVLKRNYSNEDMLRAVRTAKEHGLMVGFYNLIGIPGETKEDFRETIRLNRQCQPDWWLLSVFYPYPGTRLYETCREMGILDVMPDRSFERRKPSLELPTFSKRQIKRRYTWSFLLFHGGHRPPWEIMWRVFMTKIFSNEKLYRLWRSVSSRVSPSRKYQLEPPP